MAGIELSELAVLHHSGSIEAEFLRQKKIKNKKKLEGI